MSFLDAAMLKLNNALKSGSSMLDDFGQAWSDKMRELRDKAQEFNRVYAELESKRDIAAKDPALYREYQALLEKGDWIRSIISSITGGIDYGSNLLFGNKPPPVSELGALPLVPVVTVAAAITVITAFISSATVVINKLNVLEKMIDKGADPVQAAKSLGLDEKGALSSLADTAESTKEAIKFAIPLVVLVGIGFLFRKDIKRILEGRFRGR